MDEVGMDEAELVDMVGPVTLAEIEGARNVGSDEIEMDGVEMTEIELGRVEVGGDEMNRIERNEAEGNGIEIVVVEVDRVEEIKLNAGEVEDFKLSNVDDEVRIDRIYELDSFEENKAPTDGDEIIEVDDNELDE